MTKTNVISLLLVGAMAVATIFGVTAYRSASAAAQAATTTTNTSSVNLNGGKGMPGGVSNQELADALGITVDALNTAFQTAYTAGLDQAVQSGLITQTQADQLKSQGSAFPFGNRWDGWLSQNGIDYEALLANALGITVDQLKAAYTKTYNTKVDQEVTDGKITQEQADLMKGQYALRNDQNFQSAMQSAYEAAVNQAVTDGVITQAQADAILKNANGLNGMWMGGPGDFGGRGGGHGFGGPGGPNPNDQTAPSTTPNGGGL